jgi:hypothetical protein
MLAKTGLPRRARPRLEVRHHEGLKPLDLRRLGDPTLNEARRRPGCRVSPTYSRAGCGGSPPMGPASTASPSRHGFPFGSSCGVSATAISDWVIAVLFQAGERAIVYWLTAPLPDFIRRLGARCECLATGRRGSAANLWRANHRRGSSRKPVHRGQPDAHLGRPLLGPGMMRVQRDPDRVVEP